MAPVFLRSLFLSGPTCRADLLICLLCVGAVSFAQLEFFRVCHGPAWLWSLADVWCKTQQKRIFMYIGGGAVGLWSQLKCICGGPPSPLHRGPSVFDHLSGQCPASKPHMHIRREQIRRNFASGPQSGLPVKTLGCVLTGSILFPR